MATDESLSLSGHALSALAVLAHVQSSSHQSKGVHNSAKFREPQTSDLLMGPEDDGDDDEDDEYDMDYEPEDADDDKTYTETDYSVREGDFDLSEDEEEENEGEDEDEAEEGEDEGEDEAENKAVKLEGSDEKLENNREDDVEAANTNSARSLPVSPRPGYSSNAPQAKSKGRLPTSSTKGTPSSLPPPCAPSRSQPFPLPSYNPMTPLDPSIDLSLKGDLTPKAELESSPEPDFPSVSQMLAKTRPSASQPIKSTFESGGVEGSAHVSAIRSQDVISSNISKSPMAIDSVAPSSSQPAPKPQRPRPVACKAKPRALPIEPQSSSTLSHPATPDDEDREKNKNNGKGKRRASIESSQSCKEDISRNNLRPTKRSKLELAAPVAHKHEQFWILDGNTVLEVRGVLFKLHRSRLVDQSTFFAGLLDEQDVFMDDSVVVESDEHGLVYHLSNITPTDLEALLQLDRNPM